MRFVRRCALAAAFAVGGIGAVVADQKPAGSLAERAATQLRRVLPGYEVVVVDPLTLKFGPHGRLDWQLNLDRVQQYCASNSSSCDDVLADFVRQAVGPIKTESMPLTRSMLRAVVRSASYVSSVKNQDHAKPGQSIIATPLVGDLVLVCEFDFPTATRPARYSELRALGLSPANVVDVCKKTVEASLPTVESQMSALSRPTFGTLLGDGYTASQVIFPERWSKLAAKYHGHLIISVPADDLVIYGEETSATDINLMHELALQALAHVRRPISEHVFRWSPSGWQDITP